MWWGHVRSDAALAARAVPLADFVLVTHAHWDHVMDVPAVISKTGATAYGSPNTCQLLSILGVSKEHIHEVKVEDRFSLGGFQVQVIPAKHGLVMGRLFATGPLPANLRPPLRMRDYRMDTCFSFLIEMNGLRFLDWSSEVTGSALPADVLFVKPLREQAYYEALLGLVQPRVIIPIHWDDFMRPLSQIRTGASPVPTIPIHWDDFMRPLSQPLRPTFKPPRMAFPPLERVNLTTFKQMIQRIAPQIKVILPKIFYLYELDAFL
jgi:Beta-lactamase superfamily domain